MSETAAAMDTGLTAGPGTPYGLWHAIDQNGDRGNIDGRRGC